MVTSSQVKLLADSNDFDKFSKYVFVHLYGVCNTHVNINIINNLVKLNN